MCAPISRTLENLLDFSFSFYCWIANFGPDWFIRLNNHLIQTNGNTKKQSQYMLEWMKKVKFGPQLFDYYWLMKV